MVYSFVTISQLLEPRSAISLPTVRAKGGDNADMACDEVGERFRIACFHWYKEYIAIDSPFFRSFQPFHPTKNPLSIHSTTFAVLPLPKFALIDLDNFSLVHQSCHQQIML